MSVRAYERLKLYYAICPDSLMDSDHIYAAVVRSRMEYSELLYLCGSRSDASSREVQVCEWTPRTDL